LAAVRYQPLDALGSYALGYTAFCLAAAVPAVLVFTPVELRAVEMAHGRRRLSVVGDSLRLGAPVAVAAGVVVSIATLLIPSSTPIGTRVMLAGTMIALVALSPIQDHLRRLLHSAEQSWQAAATSGLHVLSVTGLLIVVLAVGRESDAWVPFGVLALANLLSTSWALACCRGAGAPFGRISFRHVRRQGGTLLLGSMASFASGFALMAVLTAAAGPSAAAQVEAVRLCSQPVTVVSVGLLAVLGPRIMSATLGRSSAVTHMLAGRALLLLTTMTAAYICLASLPKEANPLRVLVPRAFEVPWLLPVMVVAQVTLYAAGIYRCVPVALRASAPVLVIEAASGGLAVLLTSLLIGFGPWGAVWGLFAGGWASLLAGAVLASVLLRRRPAAQLAVDRAARS
jgi:hypothetical protein